MRALTPWKDSFEGKLIAPYLGCWGCKTGSIESLEEMVFIAAKVYGLPENLPPAQIAARISAMGKKDRRRLAYTNIPRLFPDPDEIWPADIPVRGQGGKDIQITKSGLQRMMDASQPDLIDGDLFGVEGELDVDPAKLLRKVVSAVISAGRADILWEFPEVLAFFGSRIPTADEIAGLHNVDPRMLEAAEKWPNRVR